MVYRMRRISCARVGVSSGGGVGTVGGGGGCGAGSGVEKEVVVGDLSWWWWFFWLQSTAGGIRSHTFLPSQQQTYHTVIMVKMVPYEAFVCPCGVEDVVLRESYKPKTPCLAKTLLDLNFFMERGTSLSAGWFSWSFNDSNLLYYLGSSSTPIYSPGSSSTPISSPGTLRNAECSNCKYLLDRYSRPTVDMYMHPEQHTVNSSALFHEVYNFMGKLDLE
nr:hypothetical protein [Tanacetum cinerariifolium]